MDTIGKILIADDVEMVLRLEELFLKRLGCQVIRAKTGPEALKKIQSEKPKVVLLDLEMPEMTGDAVCKFTKSSPTTKETVVIMVTSHGKKEDEERCRRSGCDYFLTKPIDHKELVSRVEEALKR
jgi:CheY-like chemotaxis protein